MVISRLHKILTSFGILIFISLAVIAVREPKSLHSKIFGNNTDKLTTSSASVYTNTNMASLKPKTQPLAPSQMSERDYESLIKAILELEKTRKEQTAASIVKRSNAVVKINNIIDTTGNSGLIMEWESFSLCLPDCKTEQFYSLIKAASHATSNSKASTILFLNEVGNYAGTDNSVSYATAVMRVDQNLNQYSAQIKNKWHEVLECSNCSEKDKLYFEMFGVIINP